MSDTNTPITGKDVRITVSVDGVVAQVQDQVTRFTRKPVYDEVMTKNLGTTGSKIDKTFSHWEGSLELAVERRTLDAMVDSINAARRKRVPVLINITEVIHYRDGSIARFTYPDCKFDFDSSSARGEAMSYTLNWKSGVDRIPA